MSPVVGIQQFPVGFSIWIYLRFFVFPGFLWGPCGFSDWVSYWISHGDFQCGDPYGGWGVLWIPLCGLLWGVLLGSHMGGSIGFWGFLMGGFYWRGSYADSCRVSDGFSYGWSSGVSYGGPIGIPMWFPIRFHIRVSYGDPCIGFPVGFPIELPIGFPMGFPRVPMGFILGFLLDVLGDFLWGSL